MYVYYNIIIPTLTQTNTVGMKISNNNKLN